MKSLADLTGDKRLKELAKHPRHKFIDICVQRINEERAGTKYKKVSAKLIAIKTAHLSQDDLGYLVKQCQQKSNFSKMFYGLLKVKK